MHEFSLAHSVFETIINIAEKQNIERIKKVILKFGMFALIQEDQFRFCFDLLKTEYKITFDSELVINWVPGELKCLKCGFEGKVEGLPQDHNELAPIFKCPACTSYSTEVISGTDTIIDSILV